MQHINCNDDGNDDAVMPYWTPLSFYCYGCGALVHARSLGGILFSVFQNDRRPGCTKRFSVWFFVEDTQGTTMRQRTNANVPCVRWVSYPCVGQWAWILRTPEKLKFQKRHKPVQNNCIYARVCLCSKIWEMNGHIHTHTHSHAHPHVFH